MKVPVYKQLAGFYDHDWGDWCLQHLPLLKRLLRERLNSPAKILDLACGTGTMAHKLSAMGHQVTGIDLSAEMIQIALSKNIPSSWFEVQDMRSFRLERKFDLITCLFDAFNYLTETKDIENCLERVWDSLKSSGLFLFDVNTRMLYFRYHNGTICRNINGQVFSQKRFYDKASGRAVTVFEFSDGFKETHIQQAYNFEDIQPSIRRSGLKIAHVFGGFNGEPYTPDCDRCICVLEK